MSDCRIPSCGECCFFETNEDRVGVCILKEQLRCCQEQCDIGHTKMKPKQIAKALHYIQKWRRGAKTAMPLPYVVGKVNDAAIYQLRKMK